MSKKYKTKVELVPWMSARPDNVENRFEVFPLINQSEYNDTIKYKVNTFFKKNS